MAANSEVHPVMAKLAQQISLRNGGLRAMEEETGIDKATLWRISHGVGVPRFHQICKLAAALGYEVRLVKSK